MLILLSNDDGIHAPGLLSLEKALSRLAPCHVVAPAEEQSATGHALSLRKPLRVKSLSETRHSLTGTPADCVYVALHHLLPERPALVVSGINDGANLSLDTWYSGTVAAAREAVMSGIPAFCVSLCTDRSLSSNTEKHWETAAELALELATLLLASPPPPDRVYSLNVPNLPASELRGVRLARLGRRHWHPRVVARQDPWGQPYLWIGGEHQGFDDILESDGPSILQGQATLSSMRLDTTATELFEDPSLHGFLRSRLDARSDLVP